MSLRLDRLMASGFDVPSQVWLCTVKPTEHKVVLKLLTDQAARMPTNLYLPQEVYEVADFGKGSMGRNSQMHLSREADRMKDLAPLQGTCVPYSFGFYEVRDLISGSGFSR